jgi:hypothetical protein
MAYENKRIIETGVGGTAFGYRYWTPFVNLTGKNAKIEFMLGKYRVIAFQKKMPHRLF